ncbi:MAG: hypothetical protein KF829_03210 [Ferruginibacter sp.]|nr:hypothetical protein [Ferruginibacter sp.]
MKKLFVFIVGCTLSLPLLAQRISRVEMSETGILSKLSIELDEQVILNLTPTGDIIDYGIDIYKGRTDRMQERMEPYTGRVVNYTNLDNEAFAGKIRYIGQKMITYYASYDDADLVGKIKSIGSTTFEYYNRYDEESLRGKIKSIGSDRIIYYSSFDPSFGGKLKSIGAVQLTYYSNFDDKAIKGKIKSIGQSQFSYYTSFDRKELVGNMRNGWRINYVNTIKFLISR